MWCLWVVVTYNEIHNYIYEHISTYRPTFSMTSTRESKDQIGMALIKAFTVHCLLIHRGHRSLLTGEASASLPR